MNAKGFSAHCQTTFPYKLEAWNKRQIFIATAESDIALDGLVMALLAAVKDQEEATERVALLTGELAKRRGVSIATD